MGWSNPEPIGLSGSDSEPLRRIFNSLTTNLNGVDTSIAAVETSIADLEAEVAALPTTPAGVVSVYAGSSAPTGYLMCYGQAVSRTTYAALFTAISTTYGTGDGSTTFNVPDLRGRVVVAPDNMGGSDAGRLDISNTLGTTAGEQKHTMTEAELYAHTHGSKGDHQHDTYTADIQILDSGSGTFVKTFSSGANFTSSNGVHEHDSVGSATPFNVMQPSIVMNYIIKT